MLRVRIELVPSYGARQVTKTWSGTIINDGTGDETTGSYYVQLNDTVLDGTTLHGRVENFPRRGTPWALLAQALRAVGL